MSVKKDPQHHVGSNPDGGWEDRAVVASAPSSHHETKREAIDETRDVSRSNGIELRVHNKDGKNGDSHGDDPKPPRAKGHCRWK